MKTHLGNVPECATCPHLEHDADGHPVGCDLEGHQGNVCPLVEEWFADFERELRNEQQKQLEFWKEGLGKFRARTRIEFIRELLGEESL